MKGVELSEKYFENSECRCLKKTSPFFCRRCPQGLSVKAASVCFSTTTFQKITTSSRDSAFFKRRGLRKIRVRLNPRVQQTSRRIFGVFPSEIFACGRQSPRHFSCKDFYESIIGRSSAPKITFDWLKIPPYALRTAVSGKMFVNNCAEFSRIREVLQKGFPEDVRLKKSRRTRFL